MKRDSKEVMQRISFHGMILLRGICKMVYGTLTAVVIILAVDGFAAVPSEGGYAAVFDFVYAVSLIVIALCGLYLFGCKKSGR